MATLPIASATPHVEWRALVADVLPRVAALEAQIHEAP